MERREQRHRRRGVFVKGRPPEGGLLAGAAAQRERVVARLGRCDTEKNLLFALCV